MDDPYPLERHTNESKRLLSVLDGQLSDREYLVGEYSIADIATFPWLNAMIEHYGATEALGIGRYTNVIRWLEQWNGRPAAQKGKTVNAVSS